MQQQKMTLGRWGEMTPLQRDVAVMKAFGWWEDGSAPRIMSGSPGGMVTIMAHLARPESRLSYRITPGAVCVFSNIVTVVSGGPDINIEVSITSERDAPSALALAAVMAVEQQRETPHA